MANPIRRLVQLVLDRRAAQQTEADAKRTLGGVERSLDNLKRVALKVGAAIVAAFSIRAVERFIGNSIQAARDAERIWNDLAGTIRATGKAYEDLEPRIRATAAAFQDATTVGDEEFAQGLSRLISLTGDVESSLNNMGLVANVAAQFFGGKLEPAIELVAKVSTGYITQLQRMGIQVKSAQEGLEVLAQRSFGAAARQMDTQEGQLARLRNAWGDMQESLGAALTNMDGGTSIIQELTKAVQSLERWIIANKQQIQEWVGKGFRTLVIWNDAVYRGIKATALLLGGLLRVNAGVATAAVAGVTQAFVTLFQVLTAAPRFLGARAAALIGLDGVAKSMDNFGDSILQTADNLRKFGVQMASGGLDWLKAIPGTLARRTSLANSLLNPGPFVAGADPTGNRPVLPPGSGGDDEAEQAKEITDKIGESFERYSEALRVAHGLHELLGKDFDLTGAKVAALEQHITELLSNGFDPMDPYLKALSEQLEGLRQRVDPVSDAINSFDHELQTFDTLSQAMGGSFDMLQAKAGALETVIRSLAEQGMQASNPIMQYYIGQLQQVEEAMRRSEEQAENYGLAVSNLSSLIAGSIGGELAEVAKAKAKENLLLAAEQLAQGIVASLNPFTAGKAPWHFAAAAKFSAIAAGWAALGQVAGGGGGGGNALAGSRGASGPAAERAEPPGPEISIYLTGDMNALDPRVQKWVLGAAQAGRERYGDNAIVRTIPAGRR